MRYATSSLPAVSFRSVRYILPHVVSDIDTRRALQPSHLTRTRSSHRETATRPLDSRPTYRIVDRAMSPPTTFLVDDGCGDA